MPHFASRTRGFLLSSLVLSLPLAALQAKEAAPVPVTAPVPAAAAVPLELLPDDAAIKTALKEAYEKFRDDQSGKNASYIPALAEVDSKLFGISLVTVDGRRFDIGDSAAVFSIQSISKIFVMALALREVGTGGILEKIGVDATGRAFNSIVALEDSTGHSQNPCVNAGAIATTSLIKGASYDAKWKTISTYLEGCAGNPMPFLDKVYESEAATNLRNRAIGDLLAAYNRIYADSEETVDLYTRQCSVGVTSRDLSAMASTLANGGVNPLTKQKLLEPRDVPGVLAVMAAAGLYDRSGTWLFTVGLPAKSGVGGGIIAVAPGKFGIAAFSPPLDPAGNSIRSQKAIAYITEKLGANVFYATPR